MKSVRTFEILHIDLDEDLSYGNVDGFCKDDKGYYYFHGYDTERDSWCIDFYVLTDELSQRLLKLVEREKSLFDIEDEYKHLTNEFFEIESELELIRLNVIFEDVDFCKVCKVKGSLRSWWHEPTFFEVIK